MDETELTEAGGAPEDAAPPTDPEAATAEAPVVPTEDAPAAEGAPAEGGEEAQGPADPRTREVVKGIHPELICHCPECTPEFCELQWFSPEEKVKTKGNVMLYCQRSSRKYFSPAVDFQAWLAEKPAPTKRGRGQAV